MFDFFRDMAKEIKGDYRVVPPGNIEKPKRDTLLPRWARNLIIVFGILYLIMAIPQVILIVTVGNEIEKMIIGAVVYALQIIIDLIVLISLIFGKKKGEKIAIGGITVFVLIMYASLYLL